MPGLFSRLKGKDNKDKSKKNVQLHNLGDHHFAQNQKWEDAWARQTVEPEEVFELINRSTGELKARALDLPFLLLPFRPASDPSSARTFVRHFFDGRQPLRGEALARELRMTEPMVISGVLKWCWSRLHGGVVGWDSYELFKVGEQDSNMARDSFKTFIPLSVENETRSRIIFDFFDLLSAVAAHGKMNGFGGRKLSRLAAWWAFEHMDTGSGFDGGYRAWLSAADATSHLFFAYLRSLAPQSSRGAISMLPMSLEKLLAETEYPPQRPMLLQAKTNRVVMIVETVSPTPFALLRRANHFQYRDDDRALREWSEYEDPIQALTEECRRVLRAISAANQSHAASSSKHSTSLRDASWSRFEDLGFASALDDEDEFEELRTGANRRRSVLRTTPASGTHGGRPTTPSWADFLSSGFVDDERSGRPNVLLPPDKVLPPIDTQIRQRSAQSHKPRLESHSHLEPGELASITRFDFDEAFWWVWMSSLAPEETAERKSAFGRCAVVETTIRAGRWLVMEEMLKGAAPEPEAGAYIAEKKGFFSWTRRNKGEAGVVARSKSNKHTLDKADDGHKPSTTMGYSKTSFGVDQQAKIQAAAQELQARHMYELQQQAQQQQQATRRGRSDADIMAEKTKSVLTLQPGVVTEASPAVKWANKYDKEAIREAYLANMNAGRGRAAATMPTNDHGAYSYDGPASPAAMPDTPSFAPRDDSEDEPTLPTEKRLEAPREAHPAEREANAGRSSPLPPTIRHPDEHVEAAAQPSMDFARDMTSHLQPKSSAGKKKAAKKLQKDKEKSSGGFRRLFGRKNRTSKVPDNAAAQLHAMGVENEHASAYVPVEDDDNLGGPERMVETLAEAPPVVKPTADEEADYLALDYESVSRVHSPDAAEAAEEFSRFDQGPLTDQPAFDGDDYESDEAAPPPIAKHRSRSPMAEYNDEDGGPTSGHVTPHALSAQVAAPSQDRWARIRTNAANRAVGRPGEGQGRGGYSQATTTDGDEDTSGEEPIESRVARIKARVAELTGNMEGVGSQGASTTGPVRR